MSTHSVEGGTLSEQQKIELPDISLKIASVGSRLKRLGDQNRQCSASHVWALDLNSRFGETTGPFYPVQHEGQN